MIFCRKTLLSAAVFCLFAFAFQLVAGELEKWVPADGLCYGKVSGKVIRESALFKNLMQKYPAFQAQLESGRAYIGNYQGDLDTAVFAVSPHTFGTVLLLEFSKPYDPAAIAAGLAARGREGAYKKFTVAGKEGFVLTRPTAKERSCFVMLSPRVMLGCPEASAETVITGPKVSGALAQKLQDCMTAPEVFFRAFHGGAETASVFPLYFQDFDITGRLAGDVLKLDCRVKFPDEQTAQNTEIQIRQGMAMMLGLAFADDAELGMALYSRIKVKRKKNDISVKASLSADLIERLVNYSCTQIEKKKQAKSVQRARRKTGAPAVQ
ncbi:MAG: hypothetical protein J6S73_03635 [Lentisphaeria bacterium]|nr:hypothetical protein [Lentisphaeria bacterium]